MQKSVWLLFSILLLACGEEGVVPELGHGYYPIEIGEYRIYEVTETTYVNKISTTDTYQLRERFTEQIQSGEEISYLLLIERKENGEDFWLPVESVYVRQAQYYLEYRKDNVSYVPMSYPVRVGREWNGNALNSESRAIYYYSEGSIDSIEEDQIKVIISELPPNIVEEDERFEIYAHGIGLVERNFVTIEYCQQNCTGVNEPENGRILIQQLVEYGSE